MPTTILGTQGDDVLTGTAGDDVIVTGWGDDEVDGGDGNDTIIDTEGSSVLRGGAGNDLICLSGELNGSTIYQNIYRAKLIEAGDGDDVVEVQRSELQDLTIDLGSGADLLTLSIGSGGVSSHITTGAGADRIVLDGAAGDALRSVDGGPFVIADFTAGAGGDILDLGAAIEKLLAWNAHAANPFASGHLLLVQDGADVIVRIDIDGAAGAGSGGWYDRELFRLENVNVADLTAYNFAGYDPNGAALVHTIVNGTGASEWLNADVGGSDVNGLGGNDQLTGSYRDDVLDGGIGNDTLNGGYGNDVIRGGDGDDVLLDLSGSDTFEGGAGNDTIDIRRPLGDDILDVVTINAGDGDDFVRFESSDDTLLTVDLGAGNDRYEKLQGGQLTLGAGQDRVVFAGSTIGNLGSSQPLVITDFAAGNSGDILELDRLSTSGWDFVTNPFTTGHLRLEQDGADTLIIADYDGSGGSGYTTELARLVGVDANSLTAFNFNGYAPNGSVSSFTVSAGTSGDDHIYGSYGSDSINGGDGNDIIEDRKSGSDTLIGGAGDDTIILRRYDAYVPGPKSVTIDAGTGRDTVELGISSGQLSVDLGADDDRVIIHELSSSGTFFALGSGSDVIELSELSSSSGNWPLTITDFQTGNGGDRLDWASYAEHRSGKGDPDFNPFYEGNARLVQVGADVQLQIAYSNGTGELSDLFFTVMTFSNTNVADFNAYNLGYEPFHPTASGGAGDDTLTGTAGADVLYGNGGNDQLNGLDGDDVIWAHDGADTLSGGAGVDFLRGGAGNDTLNGGAGADNLDGDRGIDIVDGGDGDDLIYDWLGIDTIIGGAGNDTINVALGHDSFAPVFGSLSAGDGNDIVNLKNSYVRDGYAIDLGAGDDILRMQHPTGPITLGEGRDTIEWATSYNMNGMLTITDFAEGDAGDIFDLRVFLNGPLGAGNVVSEWGFDPFALGYAELRQVGSDVRLYINRQGYNATEYSSPPEVIFKNADLSQFTAANFGGFDPHAIPNWTNVISGNYTVAAGEVVTSVNVTAVYGQSSAFMFHLVSDATLTNHGMITSRVDGMPGGSATGIHAGPFASGVSFINASDGTVLVRTDWLDQTVEAYGTYGGVSLRNDGHFEVTAVAGTAYGHYTEAAFINTGTFNVTGGYEAYGIYASYNSTFINTGAINVHGGEYAVGVLWHDILVQGFNNAGTINVTTDPDSPYASVGVYLGGRSDIQYHHYNSGTMTADIAVYSAAWIRTGPGAYQIVDYLHNSGTIDGAVMLAAGNDVVENSGTMYGATLLEDGDDLYEGSAGQHFGTVEGGIGNDILIGGSGDDVFFGDGGNDTLIGGSGDDYLEGGMGGDTLDGGAGFDTLSYAESLLGVSVNLATERATDGQSTDGIRGFEQVIGSHQNDVITGSNAAEVLIGARGNDTLSGGGGDDVLRGERGNDSMTGGAGNDAFLFSFGDGLDTVQDFAAGDTLEIYGYLSAQSITQVGADVVITLSATDKLTVKNVSMATVQPALAFFGPKLGSVPVSMDQPIIGQGDNLLIGEGSEIVIDNPQDVQLNRVVLTSVAITLFGDGVPADLFNAGSVTLNISGDAGTAYGVLGTGDTNGQLDAVNLATGTIRVQSSTADAVGVQGVKNVWNFGTVEVINLTGNAVGLRADISGQVHNVGTLHVQAAGTASSMDQGSSSSGPTKVFNSGDIIIEGGAGSSGLEFITSTHPVAAPAVFVNTGTIQVTDSTAAKDSAGIYVDWGGSAGIWNSGTIEGEYSIRRAYGYTGGDGTLSVHNSGDLLGDVDLKLGGTSGQRVFFINTGLIDGYVRLNVSNDVFDGRNGTLTGMLDGGDGNDQLLTGAGNHTILGGFGDDLLSGGAGVDTLTGGSGADKFRYEAGFGIDTITDFNAAAGDRIEVRGYANWTTMVQQGADVVVTFAAGEQLVFKNVNLADINASHFTFGAAAIADNSIPIAPSPVAPPPTPGPAAGSFQFPVVGTEAGETLAGTAGNDSIYGSGGDDILVGGTGNDTLNGGAGTDIADYGSAASAVVVDLSRTGPQATGGAGADSLQLIEGISGSAFADILIGDTLANQLFGMAGDDDLRGGGGDDRLNGGAGNDRLDGGAGSDIVSYAGAASGVTVSLAVTGAQNTGGGGSDTLISIEGLIGTSFNDQLTGDSADNQLEGGAGNDTLDGGLGRDTAGYGAAGAGVIVSLGIAGAQDTAGAGTDTLSGIEDIVGSEYGDRLIGNASSNYLFGNGGNDILDGREGTDHLDGGEGSDTYAVYFANHHGAAEINDLGQTGTDELCFASTVASTLTLYAGDVGLESVVVGTLAGGWGTPAVAVTTGTTALNVDASLVANSLTITGNDGVNILTGTAFSDIINGNGDADQLVGGGGGDSLMGGAGADRLTGGSGNDLLDGGADADKLFGGTGDDTYIVDHASDIIVEYAGEGTDQVWASVNHTLRDNVENIVLTGIYSIYANGNALANVMTGNSGANKLYGLGGSDTLIGMDGNDTLDGGLGADTMTGGAGNEQYYVDDASDVVTENVGEGIDTVRTTIDHTLGANIENMILLGTADLHGTGNSLNNVMTGNGGDNQFSGGAGIDQLKGLAGSDTLDGGSGSDRLYGGTGDDSYIVDTSGDLIFENAGEGIDTAQSSSTYVLAANVENLELTGSANLSGTGNGEDNQLTGNAGANILYGGLGSDTLNGRDGADVLKGEDGNDALTGGAGRDRFYGGTGADEFIFNDGDFAGLTSSTSDQVHDFSQADGDIIRLDGVDANSAQAGDQGFAFIGSGAFSHTAGELRTQQISGNTYVQGDIDGDGVADFWIRLDGLHALGSGDFIL